MRASDIVSASASKALLLAGLLAACALVPALSAGAPPRKVVVLGFDGADPKLIRQYMADGDMPNLKALADRGGFRDLRITNPPQTPVSWASFMSSWNPGRTQIFDFLRRDVKTYKPSFALNEEVSRTVGVGRYNPWAAAAAGLLAAVLLALLLRLAVRRGSLSRWLVGGAVVGLALGAGAFVLVGKYVPPRIPYPLNHRQGKPFWEYAADAGKKCLVFRVPDTFPAEPFADGRLVAGLGVPDMRGRVGTPYVFTTDPSLTAGDNEFSVEIVPVPYDIELEPVTVSMQGPFNKPFYEYALADAEQGCADPDVKAEVRAQAQKRLDAAGVKPTVDVPLTLSSDAATGAVGIDLQGQKASLKKGQWSEWMEVDFAFNRLVHLKGLVRFYLMEPLPNLRLYMCPIQFHPEDHGIPLSYPPGYAETLMKRFGCFKTMGWAVDTWTISSGLADEEQFLTDMYQTEAAYEKMMQALLKDGDWDLYVQVYEFTDRIGHVLWRYVDEKHPLYDAAKAPKYRQALRDAYKYMDKIVGEAVAAVPPGTPVMVLSDHGFASFRKEVNYNRWLVDHGYMTLSADTGVMTLEDLFDDNRLLFKNVDWSKTRAYALGLGNIYVNLKGREAHGIVAPGAEYDALCAALKREVPEMVDPETGERPVKAVYHRDEIYRDYDPSLVPDLRVTNTPGYRVSWQTSLGGVPEALVTVNAKAWSGDHCSLDPSFVPGAFFLSEPLARDPDMLDAAPTVLDLLGVSVPPSMEGRPLTAAEPKK